DYYCSLYMGSGIWVF
nr:immunoglobulin light chain junction region [Macaca mulatta]MOW27719.1 immunoglobulin light chain junction region [Macaca mulatta]MOW28883.1 immunoglobulin light chain junction region [Macaca mulatta]MOW29102.1 immunoglobulin light chain junction region [Macaca mulatta]MOW29519.1 immunoglobulin light chain junction region [Macaca mulatta]